MYFVMGNVSSDGLWLSLLENIVTLKLNWTGRVISLTLPSVCICIGQISFLAAF
jgi:hypothetical protein